MNKEEILNASRKENGNKDLVEVEVYNEAGNYATRVGATTCCILSLLSFWIADTFIFSPWVIYFSILATHWLIRYKKKKIKSDLILTVMFMLLSLGALVGFVYRLFEVSA